MTMTMTVATSRCISQSADFRLMDVKSGELSDFATQKIAHVNAFSWTASVCFAGVGRTAHVDVGEWLGELVRALSFDAPFEQLIDELLTADDWLVSLPDPVRRHTFSVGAFIGSEPLLCLVSNFETLTGEPRDVPESHLSLHRVKPVRPTVLVSGQRHSVPRSERRRLATLAAKDPPPMEMEEALYAANQRAADANSLVSPACFTAFARLTGEGGGRPHGLGDQPFFPTFALPPDIEPAIRRIVEEHFGPGSGRLASFSTGPS